MRIKVKTAASRGRMYNGRLVQMLEIGGYSELRNNGKQGLSSS